MENGSGEWRMENRSGEWRIENREWIMENQE